MTPEGESAVAGVVAGLPEAQGVLCGSILSGLRMQPGHWSGAYVCWGTENREAAVRFLDRRAEQSARRERRGEGHRPVGESRTSRRRRYSDSPSTASSASFRLLPRRPSTPPHSPTSSAPQAGIKLLPTSQAEALDALDRSALMRGILGDPAVDAMVAVRRYEQENYGDLSADELAEKFRLAWSV